MRVKITIKNRNIIERTIRCMIEKKDAEYG